MQFRRRQLLAFAFLLPRLPAEILAAGGIGDAAFLGFRQYLLKPPAAELGVDRGRHGGQFPAALAVLGQLIADRAQFGGQPALPGRLVVAFLGHERPELHRLEALFVIRPTGIVHVHVHMVLGIGLFVFLERPRGQVLVQAGDHVADGDILLLAVAVGGARRAGFSRRARHPREQPVDRRCHHRLGDAFIPGLCPHAADALGGAT